MLELAVEEDTTPRSSVDHTHTELLEKTEDDSTQPTQSYNCEEVRS